MLLTFASKVPKPTNDQIKKLINNFPESLTRYIEKSFQKCVVSEDRVFMECELRTIFQRCKERQILFVRDWDSVVLPCLHKESKTFQNINRMIKEGDQGIARKVQHLLDGQSNNQSQAFSGMDRDPNNSYRFNFQGGKQESQRQNVFGSAGVNSMF